MIESGIHMIIFVFLFVERLRHAKLLSHYVANQFFSLACWQPKFKCKLLLQQTSCFPPLGDVSVKTEPVLESYFTDVTFDPCQTTMYLGHVLGQAR